jgi:hypothetical protein
MPACWHTGSLSGETPRGDAGMLAYWHAGSPSGDLPPSPRPPPGMLACWHTGMLAVRPSSRPPPGALPPGRPSEESRGLLPGDAGILAYGHTGRPPGDLLPVPEPPRGDAGILACWQSIRGVFLLPRDLSWDAGMLAPGCWHTGRPPGGTPPTMPANLTSLRGASPRIAGSSSGRSLPRSPLGPIRLEI